MWFLRDYLTEKSFLRARPWTIAFAVSALVPVCLTLAAILAGRRLLRRRFAQLTLSLATAFASMVFMPHIWFSVAVVVCQFLGPCLGLDI
jgi:hypothetical protein